MTYAMIGTWRMAFEGIQKAMADLKNGGQSTDAIETAIKKVEDYPFFKSVSYGGLPNAQGLVEMDAAFMDGNTFAIGAVAGISDVKNPISVARQLSDAQLRLGSWLVRERHNMRCLTVLKAVIC